jgi:hypothetical protein
MDPWVSHGEVRVDPQLPEWIHRLRVENIEIAGESLTIDVDNGTFEVTGNGHLKVVRSARVPLTAAHAPGAP